VTVVKAEYFPSALVGIPQESIGAPIASIGVERIGSGRRHSVLDAQISFSSALKKNNARIERQIMTHGVIVEIPELGGLHHPYERIAA
jgi:hypothetical protein